MDEIVQCIAKKKGKRQKWESETENGSNFTNERKSAIKSSNIISTGVKLDLKKR